MVLTGLKVQKKLAQRIHVFLSQAALLAKNLRPKTSEVHVFFPLSKKPTQNQLKKLKKIDPTASIVKTVFKKNEKRKKSFKDALLGKLSKKELSLVNRAFDAIGNIAIIEVPDKLKGKEKIIGQALLSSNKQIETVCVKTGAHKGVFRVEPVKVVAGKKNLVATYKESGCVFKVHLGKVFFSPRLGAERLRIAKQVKRGEVVAALFAGVGPFPIVLAKNSPMGKAFAVELNPHAVKDLRENIRLNKVEDKVEPVLSDVKKIVPKLLAQKCDRVLMPLPKDAELFLPEAFDCLKPRGGVIHFYGFADKSNPFEPFIKIVKKVAENKKRKIRVLGKRELRTYSPETIQVVLDFKVL